jgi:hypothetical protein
LFGVQMMIILVRSLKAASSSPGSRVKSALVLGSFPCYEYEYMQNNDAYSHTTRNKFTSGLEIFMLRNFCTYRSERNKDHLPSSHLHHRRIAVKEWLNDNNLGEQENRVAMGQKLLCS